MELTETYTLPVPPQRAWAALNDAEILRASIPGCERIEAEGDNAYSLAVVVPVNGAKARLKGRMSLTEIEAPRACTLLFEVESGGADAGRNRARLRLEADGDAATTLSYTAHARTDALAGVDDAGAVVRKVADEFFKRFAAHLSGSETALPNDAPQPPEPSVQHAAVLQSAPAGKGAKSWKAWTAKS